MVVRFGGQTAADEHQSRSPLPPVTGEALSSRTATRPALSSRSSWVQRAAPAPGAGDTTASMPSGEVSALRPGRFRSDVG